MDREGGRRGETEDGGMGREASWGVLWASWDDLGAFWRRLGGVLCRSYGVLGGHEASKSRCFMFMALFSPIFVV